MQSTFDDIIRNSHRYPLLTKPQEIELSRLYQQSLLPEATAGQKRAGKRAQDRLLLSNQRLVAKAVIKFQRRLTGAGLDQCDLFQAGMLGLVRATEKFDSERGYAFSTYATLWIEQAIRREIDYARDVIRQPSNAITITRRWRYRPEGQSLDEFCEQYDYKPETVRKELEHAARAQVGSLDTPCKSDASERSTIGELIAADDTCTLDSVDYADAIEAIRSSCPDELALVELRAGGVGKGELAQLLGTSPRCLAERLQAAREELIANTPTHVAAMMGGPMTTGTVVLDRPDFHEISPLTMTVTPSTNGHHAEALEACLEQPAAKPRRKRRTKEEMAAARAAKAPVAVAGVVKMTVGEVVIEASASDAVMLLQGLTRAAA